MDLPIYWTLRAGKLPRLSTMQERSQEQLQDIPLSKLKVTWDASTFINNAATVPGAEGGWTEIDLALRAVSISLLMAPRLRVVRVDRFMRSAQVTAPEKVWPLTSPMVAMVAMPKVD